MVYLPQRDMANTMLTVFETVLLGRISSLTWKVQDEDLEKVYQALCSLGIEDLSKKVVANLSGGQKKLVSIAQTLVRDPKVVLMDEPTNSLDMKKKLELFEIIEQITEHKDISFIMVLHDLNLACRYAEHLIILDENGKTFASGKPSEIVNEEMIQEIYGLHASILYNEKGNPIILPQSSTRRIDLFQGGKELW